MSHLKNIVPVNVILNLLYDLKNALIIKKQNESDCIMMGVLWRY